MNNQSVMAVAKRLLKVALIGAPNVGKSTLLNKLVMNDISCVSSKVHTTRSNVLAVYTDGDCQLEFYDSPGLVTRQHLLKHRLEDSLANDPKVAAHKCDLIAVVVDANNPREGRKLNRGLLKILQDHSDKESFLILNKVDLVREKRMLLEIGARLSEGHLENKLVMDRSHIERILKRKVIRQIRPTSKYVIELDKNNDVYEQIQDQIHTEPVGYKNFHRVFSISALQDDGVDDLRSAMIERAKPVELWPHGPGFVSNHTSKEIVHSIIRGKVMDYTDSHIPYSVRYLFKQFAYDEYGSLHVILELNVPYKYMVGKIVGEHGVTVFKIINESREKISSVLACDVKLNITVETS